MGKLQEVAGRARAFVGGAKNKGVREGSGERVVGWVGGRWVGHGPRGWRTRFNRWVAGVGKGRKARG